MELSIRSMLLNTKKENINGKYICLWLKRDFRYEDNWAFVEAIKYSKKYSLPIKVFVYLPKDLHNNNSPSEYCILYPSKRHYDFLIKSLKVFETIINKHGIPLEYRSDKSPILALKNDFNDSLLVITDFKPTIPAIKCDKNVCSKINVKMIQIDSHNIVPLWVASPNAEYMARTIRNKLWSKADTYLTNYPAYMSFKQKPIKSSNSIPDLKSLSVLEDKIEFITNTKPGYFFGMKRFNDFIKNNLKNYNHRNNPNIENAQSNMSIYINYGAVSPQRLVYLLHNMKNSKLKNNIEEYIEEVWVRRELAENYCYYKDYLSINSAWDWAKKLMNEEKNKKQVYSLKQMECGNTNDAAWNACEYQLISTGRMHGYMRMYWAKKISDWTSNRQIALNIANYLNDKYEMDGSSSGGYTGTAWSIIGVHDRNFYGKFRPMTLAGLKRNKIDINTYINKYSKPSSFFC
uniref:Photolyase/cryptochrome alpha/beta domain-containing protein n=1 Tax=viral metagenome TaxID=1070528 RepID=A0A6C0AHN8_9ZZZZ